MLVGKQFAGAPHAGLHFIEYQQRLMRIAGAAGGFEKGFLRGQHAALALHRLDNHGTGLRADGRFERGGIVIGHMGDGRRQRGEILAVFGLTAHRHGKQGAAVEAVDASDDFALALAEMVARVFARQLQRRFVGFGARVAEKRLVGKRGTHQLLRQRLCGFGGVDIGNMPQLVRLLFERFNQRRVAMPQCVYCNAARQVDVFAPFGVPHAATLRMIGNDGGKRKIGGEIILHGAASFGGVCCRGLLCAARALISIRFLLVQTACFIWQAV